MNLTGTQPDTGARHRWSRRFAPLLLGVVVTAGLVGNPDPAEAQILLSSAWLECRPGQVTAYMPSIYTTQGTLGKSGLEATAELWAWSAYYQRWLPAVDYRNRPVTWKGFAWTTEYGTLYGPAWYSQIGFPFPFNSVSVAPGNWYAVKTSIYDRGDGTTFTMWNSGAAGTSCKA